MNRTKMWDTKERRGEKGRWRKEINKCREIREGENKRNEMLLMEGEDKQNWEDKKKDE